MSTHFDGIGRDITQRMEKIDQSQIGTLGPEPTNSSEPPRKVSYLLFLWPFTGFILVVAAVVTYPPLDDALIWWVGGVPCLVVYSLINIAWRKAKSCEDARFLPRSAWLAIGSLLVPMILFLNGALDRSPVEQHLQVITRTILTHHRGAAFYYLELTSWRGRAHEKLMVSEIWYSEAKPGDPAIVETHKGALGIPLLVSVHRPD
jgi:hypothetical protein